LANVRGSEADPTFVEEYITDLLDAHSLDENDSCITDVQMIRSHRLKDLGMNLLLAMG